MFDAHDLKASDALEAMVRGLLSVKDEYGFTVRMRTFGYSYVNNGHCSACPVTLAITELVGKTEPVEDLRYLMSMTIPTKYQALGGCLELARCGVVSDLIAYSSGFPSITEWDNQWSITKENWESELPKIQKAIAEMRTKGY